MANILAGREVVREFLQTDATPEKVSSELLRLIVSSEERKSLSEELKEVTNPLAESGSYALAAEETLEVIKKN